MMDRGTVRNMSNFIPKKNSEKLVHLVGFIIRIITQIKFHYRYFSRAGSGQAVDYQNLPNGHEANSVMYQLTTNTYTEM